MANANDNSQQETLEDDEEGEFVRIGDIDASTTNLTASASTSFKLNRTEGKKYYHVSSHLTLEEAIKELEGEKYCGDKPVWTRKNTQKSRLKRERKFFHAMFKGFVFVLFSL
jgi:hypothetical protein